VKPWIIYSLLRLGIFAAVFALLMVAQSDWWLSALIAAIVGFAVSYIFFGKLRDAVALDIVARRSTASHDPDRDAEDAAADLSAGNQNLEGDR
jgi:uncharacterized membrane protein YciS (DUF1049 family)